MVLRLIREHAWAPRILVYYLRALGIILLIRALFHWMSVLGMNSWFSTAFLDMEMPWRIMTVYFAALDAIAAVGLWFGAVWGVAGFLFAAVTEVVMHLVFPDMFGNTSDGGRFRLRGGDRLRPSGLVGGYAGKHRRAPSSST